MKKLIKIIIAFCALISIMGTFSIASLASNGVNNQDDYESVESDYFHFLEPGDNRMDSYGYYTFSFGNAMPSDLFRPANSTITNTITATSTNSNQTYYVTVYKADGTYVSQKTLSADGNAHSYQISGLNTNERYYLYFSKPAFSGNTISGYGHLVSIAEVY